FADPFGRTAQQWGCASREAFVKAAAHMAERVEAVEISFEGKALPGYFMTPAAGAPQGRTVLILTGFDGTAEELFVQTARAGLERDSTCSPPKARDRSAACACIPNSRSGPISNNRLAR